MIAWAVTDLPEPDSPSTARVSPGSRWYETPLITLADAVAGVELDVQVPHLEQVRTVAAGGRRRSWLNWIGRS